MPKTTTINIEPKHLKKGLWLLDDDSEAPFGSARSMLNVMITDRGGISPRPGTSLLGTYNSSTKPVKGLFNFKKANATSEILMKSYSTKLEFLHSTVAEDWATLKTGFTDDQEFGFIENLVNSDNDDFVYFCNRYEPYQRWRGAVTQLNGALVGAETTVTVDTTLRPAVYESKTASASSATTLDVTATPWTASQWVNFYVYITSGVHSGKIRKITANTSSQITFDTLGSDPSSPTFEIRMPAFPATGTIIYGGTTLAYTAIPTATTFTVASAHAGADNAVVALAPEEFVGAPRGNRLETVLGRPFVGNVRSALSRDSGGTLQGSAQAGSVFVAKINNPSDFTFSASRVAGEGDIFSTPYGGGDITDIKGQEAVAYIYKRGYIEGVKYSGDTDDTIVRVPLKTGQGSVGRVIKGADDHYFMNDQKEFTSLGRVKLKDSTVQSENFGLRIKRLLDSYEHNSFNGIEYRNRIISAHKSDSTVSANDVMLVFNRETKSYEGIWSLSANNFEVFEDLCYFGSSRSANVYQLFTNRKVDYQDASTTYPYTARWESNFFSVIPIQGNVQGINSVYLEGRIKANSTFTFKLFKDFSTDSFIQFNFSGTEDEFMTTGLEGSFLGDKPLGLTPLGSLDDEGDGYRRFTFVVYFPWQYGRYLSVGVQSEGKDQDWELLKVGLGVRESVSTKVDKIKSI